MSIEVRVENTPNPNSLKFVVNATVSPSTQWFADANAAANNPLAAAIFGLGGVANVMLLNDFVTVGKLASTSWDDLRPGVEKLIGDHITP